MAQNENQGLYEEFTERLLDLMAELSAINHPAAVAAVGAFASEVAYVLSTTHPKHSKEFNNALIATLHEINAGTAGYAVEESTSTH